MTSNMAFTSLLLLALSGVFLCQAAIRTPPIGRIPKLDLPTAIDDPMPCNYYGEYNTVFCQYLNEDINSLLGQTLLIVTQALTSFGVATFNAEVVYSDGPSIPENTFSGYAIDGIIFGSNGFKSIPYHLLGSLGQELVSLAIEDEQAIRELQPPDIQLPFAGSLQVLVFANLGISSIASGSFNQYTDLQELSFGLCPLVTIDGNFQAPPTITTLSLTYDELTYIAPGALRQLVNLLSLDLSYNELQTLDEGAFQGIDFVTQISLTGNPWTCDCQLQWLKDWLKDRNLLGSSGATCAYPTQAPFADVDFCPQPPTTTTNHNPPTTNPQPPPSN